MDPRQAELAKTRRNHRSTGRSPCAAGLIHPLLSSILPRQLHGVAAKSVNTLISSMPGGVPQKVLAPGAISPNRWGSPSFREALSSQAFGVPSAAKNMNKAILYPLLNLRYEYNNVDQYQAFADTLMRLTQQRGKEDISVLHQIGLSDAIGPSENEVAETLRHKGARLTVERGSLQRGLQKALLWEATLQQDLQLICMALQHANKQRDLAEGRCQVAATDLSDRNQMIASLRRDNTALLASADAARTERDIVTKQLEDSQTISQSLISLVVELSSRLRSLKGTVKQQLAALKMLQSKKAEVIGRAEGAERQASNYKRQALSFEDKANMHQVESQRAHSSLLIAQDTIEVLQRESAGKSGTIVELEATVQRQQQAILSLQHEKDRALAAAQTERGNVNKLQAEYEEMQTANAALKSYLSTAEDQAANSERLLQASSKEAQQFQDSMVEKIKVMQNQAEDETCRLAAHLLVEAAVQKAMVKDDYMRGMQKLERSCKSIQLQACLDKVEAKEALAAKETREKQHLIATQEYKQAVQQLQQELAAGKQEAITLQQSLQEGKASSVRAAQVEKNACRLAAYLMTKAAMEKAVASDNHMRQVQAVSNKMEDEACRLAAHLMVKAAVQKAVLKDNHVQQVTEHKRVVVHLQQQSDERTKQARRATDEYMKVACELLPGGTYFENVKALAEELSQLKAKHAVPWSKASAEERAKMKLGLDVLSPWDHLFRRRACKEESNNGSLKAHRPGKAMETQRAVDAQALAKEPAELQAEAYGQSTLRGSRFHPSPPHLKAHHTTASSPHLGDSACKRAEQQSDAGCPRNCNTKAIAEARMRADRDMFLLLNGSHPLHAYPASSPPLGSCSCLMAQKQVASPSAKTTNMVTNDESKLQGQLEPFLSLKGAISPPHGIAYCQEDSNGLALDADRPGETVQRQPPSARSQDVPAPFIASEARSTQNHAMPGTMLVVKQQAKIQIDSRCLAERQGKFKAKAVPSQAVSPQMQETSKSEVAGLMQQSEANLELEAPQSSPVKPFAAKLDNALLQGTAKSGDRPIRQHTEAHPELKAVLGQSVSSSNKIEVQAAITSNAEGLQPAGARKPMSTPARARMATSSPARARAPMSSPARATSAKTDRYTNTFMGNSAAAARGSLLHAGDTLLHPGSNTVEGPKELQQPVQPSSSRAQVTEESTIALTGSPRLPITKPTILQCTAGTENAAVTTAQERVGRGPQPEAQQHVGSMQLHKGTQAPHAQQPLYNVPERDKSATHAASLHANKQAAGNKTAGCAHSAQTRTKDGPDADEWAFIDATGTAYGVVSKVMMVAFERKKLLTKKRFVYPVAKGKQGGQNLVKFEKEWKESGEIPFGEAGAWKNLDVEGAWQKVRKLDV